METRENYGKNQSYSFGASPYVGLNRGGENSQIHTPGNYNTTTVSSSSSVQQPQKCIILKPVTSNSTSKTDLKYTIIRSFTPPRRTLSNVPIRSNNETETIAQKIPISLPKIIVDVAKPKNNSNSSINTIASVETDRSTVFPVKQFPPHVQNVIGGLTSSKNGNTFTKPLVVETSQFQNKDSANNVNLNYKINSTVKLAQTYPAGINWNNNIFGQPVRTGYLNNVEHIRTDYPINIQLPKSPIVVWPPNSAWKSSPKESTSGCLSNETQKLSDSGTWSTNINWEIDNSDAYSNTSNWGDAESHPELTNVFTNNYQPISKSNKLVPTITGTKIIPNVFTPTNKTRTNNSFGYVNGQNNMSSSFLSTNSNKTFVTVPATAYNNRRFMGKRNNIININNTLGLNISPTNSMNNSFTTPISYDNARVVNKSNFINNSIPGMKIDEGFDGKKITTSLSFDNTKFMNKPNIINYYSTTVKTGIVDTIDSKDIFSVDKNEGFLEMPNTINSSTVYSKVDENIVSGNISTTSIAYNGEFLDDKQSAINNVDLKIVENIDSRYNTMTTSTSALYDSCEKILPTKSDEEELLEAPGCAFDHSFNIEIPNVSGAITDVFEAYNTSGIDSQTLPINNNVSQATSTLNFNESLSFPQLAENEFVVKEDNKNVQQNNDGTNVEDSILPDYQEDPEDLSFGFMEEQPKFSVGNFEGCEEKDEEFDLDSLIQKDQQFQVELGKKEERMMGKEKEGDGGKIDGNDSCENIIKDEVGEDFGKVGNQTSGGDSDMVCSKMGDNDVEPVSLPCGLCEKNFQDKLSLKVHLRTHSKDNDYVCEVCDRSFKQETTLKNHHLRSHTFGDKRYRCNVCEQSFVLWSLLKEHRETVHPSHDKNKCYICEKVFPNKTALKAHVQRHTDPRRYKCQYCEKVYKDRAGLNVHLVVHTQVSKFACTLCDRKFGKKNLLTDHMKIFHLKQKDHTCPECNRAFSTKNTLKRHSWIHTGEKNYICEICGRPFRQKVALTVHMKVHNKPPKPQLEVQHPFGCGTGLVNLCNSNNFVSFNECNIYKFENENVEPKYNNLVLL